VKGEILELKNTTNTMVDRLNAFAGEVTRVAREVAPTASSRPGRRGGRRRNLEGPDRPGNVMAANLTEQVRGIVKVVTAVAEGDLSQKLSVKSRGEVAALADTINNMTDTLATFAQQVTTSRREVGVDGPARRPANGPARGNMEGPDRQT